MQQMAQSDDPGQRTQFDRAVRSLGLRPETGRGGVRLVVLPGYHRVSLLASLTSAASHPATCSAESRTPLIVES